MTQPSVRIATSDRIATDSVVLTCFQRAEVQAGSWARRLHSAVARATGRPGWKGQDKQVVRASTGGRDPVLVEVHGLGRRAELTAGSLGRWLTRTVAKHQEEGARALSIVLPSHPATEGRSALPILVQLLVSSYRFRRYRRSGGGTAIRSLFVLPPSGEEENYRRTLTIARSIARAVAQARNLGNAPPNDANPEWMAEQARAIAGKLGMACRILGPKELESEGMRGLLAVGAGSSSPPRLVRLEWGEGDEIVSLVGKGVTFDTGGISIKPSRGLEEMKYDKCGACTVLGIARAIAELSLPIRFRAYLPLVENMPDGASYRPGDIVRCYNGKTVEILDTDAEGRMILADALAWAAEDKPDTLIEYSTLTGASVVALGHHGAALYSPDDALAGELLEASANSGERLWRMPLWPEFGEDMKGVHADLRNLGSPWGGANSAAAFLASFVGRTKRWAHLDIAATAYRASREGKLSGATGFGVTLTLDWLLAKTGRF